MNYNWPVRGEGIKKNKKSFCCVCACVCVYYIIYIIYYNIYKTTLITQAALWFKHLTPGSDHVNSAQF